jgi:ABC-type transport system substrate-binding protein
VTSLPGVRVLAPDRLAVTLSAPFADLPAVFSNPGTFAFPPDLTDTPDARAAFEQNPVGCGSFRIESWVRGSSISLVRTTRAVKVAGVDLTILRGSVGARAAVSGFRDGQFDATPLPPSQLKVTMSDPQLSRRLVIRPLEALTALLVPPEVVPKQTERAAIAHANDPVGAAAASGGGTPADGLIPVTTPGYVPGATVYPYDPAAASSELGGSTRKLRVYAQDADLTVLASQVVAALHAVGMPAALTGRPAGAIRVVRLSAAYPSADAIVGPLALGDEARTLLEQSRTTRDVPARQELQRATAVAELKSAIVIPLTFSGAPFVVQPGVAGAVFDSAGLPHFNQWGWVQSSR